MAENTVTIKRGEIALHTQLIRAKLNEYSAQVGLLNFDQAYNALESIHFILDAMQENLPCQADNPARG